MTAMITMVIVAEAEASRGGGGLGTFLLPMIIVMGIFYFMMIRPQRLKLFKNKTKEQIEVIKYFQKKEGILCFLSITMTDDAYMALVKAKCDSLNLKQKALDNIGLDEDEVKEIPPAMFEGFVFGDAYAKKRANGDWVSSRYQVTWLFFSATQVYVYSYTFRMDEDSKSEKTDEYFYKDVTSFSTSSESEEATDTNNKKFKVESNKFAMRVGGEPFFMSMDGVSNAEQIIQGMKQKLREKKL